MSDFPSTFGDNLFDDPIYQSVVNGWNDKRKASSQVLSGLTPFVELYCVPLSLSPKGCRRVLTPRCSMLSHLQKEQGLGGFEPPSSV